MCKNLVETLALYLTEGDEARSWELLAESMSGGRDSVYIYEDILTRTMRFVGELWEENKITVADEHIASNLCRIYFLLV